MIRTVLSLILFAVLLSEVSAQQVYLPHRRKAFQSAGGGGGIAFVAAYGDTDISLDTITTIPNVVVPAGGIILVGVSHPGGGGETITSVVFNGSENLTVIRALVNNSGGVANNAVYGIHNPTATTANIVITWSASGGSYEVAQALVYTGVENDAGVAGMYRALTTTGNDAGVGADASVAATSGDWIVSFLSNWEDTENAVVSAGQTIRRADSAIESSTFDYLSQDSNGPVSGTTSMTWVNDEFCTHIALALIPDA